MGSSGAALLALLAENISMFTSLGCVAVTTILLASLEWLLLFENVVCDSEAGKKCYEEETKQIL